MKKILCIILCFLMVIGLAACGDKDNPDETRDPIENIRPSDDDATVLPDDDDVETPTDDETKNDDINTEYREGSVEDVAQKFIKSLITLDYETALRCFNVPAETPFFTVSDIEWYLPRSNYADVADITYDSYTVIVDATKNGSDAATCVVTVKDNDSDKSKAFNLNMALDNSNKWGVKDNDFYLDAFYVVAPGGDAKLTVDGADATDYYDGKFGSSQNQYLYKLTYIGKSEKTFTVAHNNFGTDEENIYPATNNAEEPYKLVVPYADEAALTAMREIWSEFYQGTVDGKTYSEMVHLLSPTANVDMAKGIMDSISTDMLEGGHNHDFVITKMTFAEQKVGQETKWLASDKLQIAFNYSMTWMSQSFGGRTEDMNSWDIVILHYDGEKFTLDTLVNNRIFDCYDGRNDSI